MFFGLARGRRSAPSACKEKKSKVSDTFHLVPESVLCNPYCVKTQRCNIQYRVSKKIKKVSYTLHIVSKVSHTLCKLQVRPATAHLAFAWLWQRGCHRPREYRACAGPRVRRYVDNGKQISHHWRKRKKPCSNALKDLKYYRTTL